MLTEYHEVLNANYVILVVFIMHVQVLQCLQFDARLILKLLLISNNFDSHLLLRLVVQALDGLTETALAEEFEDLESVAEVVLQDYLVVAVLVVVAVIKYIHLLQSFLMPLYELR